MRALLFKVSKITLIPYSVNEHYQVGNSDVWNKQPVMGVT